MIEQLKSQVGDWIITPVPNSEKWELYLSNPKKHIGFNLIFHRPDKGRKKYFMELLEVIKNITNEDNITKLRIITNLNELDTWMTEEDDKKISIQIYYNTLIISELCPITNQCYMLSPKDLKEKYNVEIQLKYFYDDYDDFNMWENVIIPD